MVEAGIRVGGAVTLWSVAQHYVKEKLKDELHKLGLAHYCPLKRADSQCLKDALERRVGGKDREVMALAKGQGFSVKQVTRGQTDVDLNTRLVVLQSAGNLTFITDYLQAETMVRDEFDFQSSIVTGNQVSSMLVSIAKAMGGQTLRDSGGVYWMPPERVDAAFAALDRADVVLGPALDGGYYLIGAKEQVPPCFDGPQWGGERVLGDTIDLIEGAGLRYERLEPCFDVDHPADLERLRGALAGLHRSFAAYPTRVARVLEDAAFGENGRPTGAPEAEETP